MSLFLKVRLLFMLAASLGALDCKAGSNSAQPMPTPEPRAVQQLGHQVVNMWPHDTNAFTQGLIFIDGRLLESTGQQGHSSLREVELQTGKVLKQVDVPPPYFAEGITSRNGKIYQLTWQHQLGFIYDAQSFQKLGEFHYDGEGWGITTDGHSLIISDGTSRLRFLDPDSFRVTKTIAVLDGRTPVPELNELEFIKGEIYANIWHDQRIVTIDPETGRVTGWIDLGDLLQPGDIHDEEAVLNGIAYDQASGRLFVTGKLWPRLFEIKIKRQS